MSPIKNKPRRLILNRETLRAISGSAAGAMTIVNRPASDAETCGANICSCFSDCGGTY
jgi:hypothetical protein